MITKLIHALPPFINQDEIQPAHIAILDAVIMNLETAETQLKMLHPTLNVVFLTMELMRMIDDIKAIDEYAKQIKKEQDNAPKVNKFWVFDGDEIKEVTKDKFTEELGFDPEVETEENTPVNDTAE